MFEYPCMCPILECKTNFWATTSLIWASYTLAYWPFRASKFQKLCHALHEPVNVYELTLCATFPHQRFFNIIYIEIERKTYVQSLRKEANGQH